MINVVLDRQGKLLQTSGVIGQSVTFWYDSSGRVTHIFLDAGRKSAASISYDSEGRVTHIYPGDAYNEVFLSIG